MRPTSLLVPALVGLCVLAARPAPSVACDDDEDDDDDTVAVDFDLGEFGIGDIDDDLVLEFDLDIDFDDAGPRHRHDDDDDDDDDDEDEDDDWDDDDDEDEDDAALERAIEERVARAHARVQRKLATLQPRLEKLSRELARRHIHVTIPPLPPLPPLPPPAPPHRVRVDRGHGAVQPLPSGDVRTVYASRGDLRFDLDFAGLDT